MATPKSDTAFRTISEAAAAVGVAQHVLRFWETRFPSLQPMKRGGNRRYYRPADMDLLHHIRSMLHDQGLTIRGAQLALADKPKTRSVVPEAVGTAQIMPATIVQTAAANPDAGIDMAALCAIRDRLRIALAA